MGGAVSSGRNNSELIDNLMGGNYIRSRHVERAFRALDRADYMTPEALDQAYKDLAWRSGLLHMSAPCIYSEVMEGLELKPGLSFLNVGSGTGYLSTLVGLVLGSGGINHGVEVHRAVVEYANNKMQYFLENSLALDEFDFCEPKFYCGNGLCLAPLQAAYDRVYCGAGCPEEYQNYFKQLIKVGGVLVMPLNDNLVQVRRVSAREWLASTLLNVSFAALRVPARNDQADLIRLDEQSPPRLQALTRAAVRGAVRRSLLARAPELRDPPSARASPVDRNAPRRICIPLDDDSDVENLNALHDLDPAGGASEMNALLSLVLSMGHNRVAGALRFDQRGDGEHSSRASSSSRDSISSHSHTESSSDEDDDGGDDDGGDGGAPPPDADAARAEGNSVPAGAPEGERPLARSVIMFEFRDTGGAGAGAGGSAGEARPPPAATRHPADNAADDVDSDGTDDIGVPSEIEIYLGKKCRERRDKAGTSSKCGGKCGEKGGGGGESKRERELSSGEEGEEEGATQRGARYRAREGRAEEKRQKFDSGLGEENTPSSGSSPADRQPPCGPGSAAGDRDRDRRGSSSDDLCDHFVKAHRRVRVKRVRGRSGVRSSVYEIERPGGAAGAAGAEGEAGQAGEAKVCKRRAPDAAAQRAASYTARRMHTAIMMKRRIKELPLPFALKLYVNLDRPLDA